MTGKIIIPIKSGFAIREWVECYYGSPIIVPKRRSFFWEKLKFMLRVPPQGFINKNIDFDDKDYIFIQLLNSRSKSLNRDFPDKKIHINVKYRYFLDEEDEKKVVEDIKNQFHNTFLAFVMGGAMCIGVKHRDAIRNFAEYYGIQYWGINEDTLIKLWDRSIEKELCNKKLKTSKS
ncbi:MAG: hypothetical protein LBB41_02705 [Prevotellaceae bacterium]|jgi:hypothetical protein|nr:hypothetical protein [Prevotellaceae bacterium]